MVGCFSKGDAQFFTENCTDGPTKFWIGVDARSDRGATDRQVARENVASQFCARNGVGNGCCVAAKLLADADGRSVHQVRSTNLYMLVPCLGLGIKGTMQALQCWHQLLMNGNRTSHLHGSWKCVI